MATALLVLDMLADFTSGRLANPAAARITDPIAALTRAAREREDWLVIYGNDAHRPGDFELAVFGEHAMAGSPGAAVIDQLAPQPGDVIVPKRYYSAFTQTDLDATCRVRGITRLVVTGQHTDCCCRHTSRLPARSRTAPRVSQPASSASSHCRLPGRLRDAGGLTAVPGGEQAVRRPSQTRREASWPGEGDGRELYAWHRTGSQSLTVTAASPGRCGAGLRPSRGSGCQGPALAPILCR